MPSLTLSSMSSGVDISEYAMHLRAAARPERTIALRAWQLRRFAEHHPGSIRAATTSDLARYLGSHSWSANTIYSVRATFRDFYGFLVRAGRIRHSPAAALPTVRRPHREPRPAPEAVIRAAAPDARLQLMVDLGARQGLRRGEIAVIHSRDLVVDLLGWSLVVHGKGSRERTVPLLPDVAERIRAAGPGWLFPSPNGGHLSINHVGVLMRKATGGWPSHSLRRRFATVAYDGSKDLRAVQKLLGHSSIATTQLYVATRPESLRAAALWAS